MGTYGAEQPPSARVFEEDDAKFRELVLYISTKSDSDPYFGATKLNKLLFACDLFAYGVFDQPLTGTRYVKRQFGPAPRNLLALRQAMVDDGELAIRKGNFRGYTQDRPIALRPADLARFSAREVALIEEVLGMFRKVSATEISEWSHGLCGWAVAQTGDDIPYEAVFLSDRAMTAYEAERGRQLALERGWDVF